MTIAWMVLAVSAARAAAPDDGLSAQRAVLAYLVSRSALWRPGAFCVWATRPAGDREGAKAPNADLDLREPTPSFLQSIPVGEGITVLGGSSCEEGEPEGVRTRSSRQRAWNLYVATPELKDERATVEGGISCGDKCAPWYRFSLERTSAGWRVIHERLLQSGSESPAHRKSSNNKMQQTRHR
jgi:hypothetical protein